jgi:two-component system, NarL family, sensor histidine kinase UhpB
MTMLHPRGAYAQGPIKAPNMHKRQPTGARPYQGSSKAQTRHVDHRQNDRDPLHRRLAREADRWLALCIATLLLTASTQAQTPLIDSLRAVAHTTRSVGGLGDSTLVKHNANVGAAAMNAQAFDTAFAFTDKAIAVLTSWQGAAANAPFTIRSLGKAYRRKALMHYRLNDYDNSLKSALRLRDVAERAGDRKLIGTALQIMANSYRGSGDEERAYATSHQAIAVLSEAAIVPNIELADAHQVLAGLHSTDNRMDSALFHFRQALLIYESFQSATDFIAVHLNMEELFLNQGLLDSAAAHYAAASIAEQVEEGYTLGRYYGHGAKLRMLQGDARSAVELVNKAQDLALDQHNDLTEYHHIRALALAQLGKAGEAYAELRKGNDALIIDQGADQARKLAEAEAEHKRTQDALIAETRITLERDKRRLALWIAGGSLLLCGIVLFSVVTIRKRNRELAAKNVEILRTRDELVKSERMREASELRTRIARDLHDEIGSELTRLSMLGNELKRTAKEDPSALPAVADNLRGLTRQVGATMSDVVWAVDPARDNVSSLLEHAERFVQRMAAETPLQVRTIFALDTDASIPTEVKHNVFMVLKEAMNNAVKYAAASLIEVELTVKDGRYALRVADDGQGFDAVGEAKSGNGLRNMKARAERLGAMFELLTSTGQGTEVRLSGVLA